MSLRLVVTQGPQQGQTLDFAPGSTIRIGRTLRGNTLAIKDSGVSSKHLSVKSENGKWILRDLESSNGTFLNGDAVDPAAAVELRDGDCVKIGEATSISVAIGGEEESIVRRRNPRRCAVVEKSASGDSKPLRRVGRPKTSVVSGEDELEVEKKPARQVNTRQRNRRLMNRDDVVLDVIPENSEVDVAESKVVEVILENSSIGVEDRKVPAKPTRRTRTQKGKYLKKNSVSVDVPEVDAGESEVLEIIPESSRVDAEDSKVQAKPKRRARTQRGDNLQKDSVIVDVLEERESESGARVGVGEDRVEENVARGVSESSDGSEAVGVSKELDLEEMTLGQWFDFLETDLPKQITEATEEMIEGMRLKARRVREYAMEQKKEKGTAL